MVAAVTEPGPAATSSAPGRQPLIRRQETQRETTHRLREMHGGPARPGLAAFRPFSFVGAGYTLCVGGFRRPANCARETATSA